MKQREKIPINKVEEVDTKEVKKIKEKKKVKSKKNTSKWCVFFCLKMLNF